MKSFVEYYNNLKIEIEGGEQGINDKLIQAVKNSRRKGYHTDDLDMGSTIKLPPLPIQSEDRTLKMLESFLDVKTEVEEKKADEEDNQIKDKQLVLSRTMSNVSKGSSLAGDEAFKLKRNLRVKSMKIKDSMVSDEYWKVVCSRHSPFIEQELKSNKDPNINAAKLAQMHDEMELYKLQIIDMKQNL